MTKAQMQTAIENAYTRGKSEGADEAMRKHLDQRAALDHPITRRFNDLTDLMVNKGVNPNEAIRTAVNLCALVDSAKERPATDHGEASS